jgi:sulfur-oxidizing protein SoxB
MVRVGGMQYVCSPAAPIGRRISNMTLRGRPVDAGRRYKVASWAPVAEDATGEPVWDVVARYLRDKKVIRKVTLNRPALAGVEGNPGAD